MTTNQLETMLKGYRLTLAEIVYHYPDHPSLLQSFIWQEFDISPKFPKLNQFLDFWHTNLDGPVHSVRVAVKDLVSDAQMRYSQGLWVLH